MTGYGFHPEALIDVDEIWEFISIDSLDAADRTIAEILTVIRELVSFPKLGRRRPDLTSRPLRFIVVHEYLIVYASEEKPLWVIAIVHGRRNPRVDGGDLKSQRGN
jgi:plasmid stabilization system protein ParE